MEATIRWLASRNRGGVLRMSPSSNRVLVSISPVRKSPAQWAERHEADTEFLQGREESKSVRCKIHRL
jgi:hypothetical protein